MLLAAVALVLVALSPSFGRATPSGSYRPPLPPDALTNGCWPLPGHARLTFPYQVRSDHLALTHHGVRRQLVLHYDVLDAPAVRRRLHRAFERAEVLDRVRMRVEPFEDVSDSMVVRGTVVLLLPPTEHRRGRAVCGEPSSTKQFPPDGAS